MTIDAKTHNLAQRCVENPKRRSAIFLKFFLKTLKKVSVNYGFMDENDKIKSFLFNYENDHSNIHILSIIQEKYNISFRDKSDRRPLLIHKAKCVLCCVIIGCSFLRPRYVTHSCETKMNEIALFSTRFMVLRYPHFIEQQLFKLYLRSFDQLRDKSSFITNKL